MLATVNVWMDIITAILAAGIVLGFVVPHFIGSMLTGRVRKHFVNDYWDPVAHRAHDPKTYGYGHPYADDFPVTSRVWHWVNIVSFTILAISGIYIRYPFFADGRELMRYLHYTFMYIVTANLLFRLFLLKNDWRSYLIFDMEDLKMAPSIIKYYLFIGPPYEHKKKFNPLQRPTYPLLWGLIALQALTGFIIFRPTIMPGFVANIFGRPAAMAAWMRLLHSTNMRIMLLVAVVHSYLGIMEDYPVLKFFWFGQEPDWERYKHDHGHGEGAAEESKDEAVVAPSDTGDSLKEPTH